MKRRSFITLAGGTVIAWPLAARGQQSERLRRIGFLRLSPPLERELQAFLQALAEQGYVQGRNFVLVAKWGDGSVTRLPELAAELVNSGVDLIVVDGGSTARAVLALTSTIPIVMTSSADPLTTRAVQSLRRPGSNLTGLTSLDLPRIDSGTLQSRHSRAATRVLAPDTDFACRAISRGVTIRAATAIRAAGAIPIGFVRVRLPR